MAQDAQHKFFRLGVNTIAYSDGHMQVMGATLLGPGDCVVVVSNSGRTPARGTRVEVKGKINEFATFGGRSVGLHLREEDRNIKS